MRKTLSDAYELSRTALRATYRAANYLSCVAIWKSLCLRPEDVDPALAHCAPQRGARSLDPSELRPFVHDAETLLTHRFLDRAKEKGDRCVAFFEEDRLVSYGFYSTQPTPLIELDAKLHLVFDEGWVLLYDAFTVPRARGKRLQAYGTAHALAEYTTEGFKGLIGYVDLLDHATLRLGRRLGYRDIGYLFLMSLGGKYACSRTSGCQPYGLRIAHETRMAVDEDSP